MKVSVRFRLNQAWTALLAILLGLLLGYLIGRASILHTTRSRLGDYAARLLQHDEEIAAEVDTTLVKANASTAPPCSEPDITLLRQLTFESRFLKDVGRLQSGVLKCSAAMGQLSQELVLTGPDIITAHGVSIYRNHKLNMLSGVEAEIATWQDSEAVISPDIFSQFPERPLRYVVGVTDRARGIVFSRREGVVQLPIQVFRDKKDLEIDHTLYSARCSSEYAVCAVTFDPVSDMWQRNNWLLAGYIGTGLAAGLACAVALANAGYKRRSHSNQLKRAILMGKLSVAYQPIVDLSTQQIVGAEALARWTDEQGDSIRPETIIALAEAEGFVSEITRFVVTRALEEIGGILADMTDFRLSVNLAPSDLTDPRLLLLLDEKLHGTAVAPQNISFELTERATSNRDVAVAAIRRLRERGHAVFIDDFGTGYSNLAYLTELHVDGIKISRSFIATLGTDAVTASILPQIIGVAKALHLKVVVQGIEREDQAAYFASKELEILGQGWYFGMPIPARSLLYLCGEKTE